MSYLLCPLAIYLLIMGLRYLLTFLQLRKSRLQYPQFQLQPAAAVPTDLQTLFRVAISDLTPLGFKPCSYLQTLSITKLEPPTAWELLLYHPERKTYAKVELRLLAEPTQLFDLDFYTFFQDGSLLITMNGRSHGVLGEIPQAILQDSYTAETAVQWQMHQDKLSQLAVAQAPCGLAPERFIRALQTHIQKYLDHLVQTKSLIAVQPNEFRRSWRATWQQTVKMVRGSSKAAKVAKQRRSEPPLEIPIELEVQSYQRLEFLQRDLVGRKFRTWLLLGSLALFIVSYTQILNSQTFAIFMAALLFHEAGHLLTMKLFGYQDTALLFLPFLGALATARKEDATLTQKFWISLMGPLPGLVLGIVLITLVTRGSYPDWLSEAGWILISLNLFNLLPIYPLDGGQIADLLVFSHHPYLGVGFKGIGVLLLTLLGLAQPMLLIFAGLIALGIPSSFRTAKVAAKLRQELRQMPATDRDKLLQTIFKALQQLGHGKLPFAQRYSLAKTLLLSHQELQATWLTRAALSLIYCISLVGSVVGTVQAYVPEWRSALTYYVQSSEKMQARHRFNQQQIEQATARIQANPDDADAYRQRAKALIWQQDDQGALADYDQLVRLQPDDLETRLTRARYRERLGNLEEALQDYDQVLRLDSNNIAALQGRAQVHLEQKDYRAAIADYDAAIKLAPSDFWVYLDRGNARQALKDYRGAIADANAILSLEPDQPDAYMLRSQARHSLGDTQGAAIDQQKADELYETWED